MAPPGDGERRQIDSRPRCRSGVGVECDRERGALTSTIEKDARGPVRRGGGGEKGGGGGPPLPSKRKKTGGGGPFCRFLGKIFYEGGKGGGRGGTPPGGGPGGPPAGGPPPRGPPRRAARQ